MKFGGKNIINNKVNNDLFLLDKNKRWNKISVDKMPSGRYGMDISSFDNGKYILLYGGKNDKNQYQNDLWVFDVEKNKWYLIGDSQKINNFPKDAFLSSSSFIENKGVIISFGSADSLSNNIYIIDIYILKQIIALMDVYNQFYILFEEIINIY